MKYSSQYGLYMRSHPPILLAPKYSHHRDASLLQAQRVTQLRDFLLEFNNLPCVPVEAMIYVMLAIDQIPLYRGTR